VSLLLVVSLMGGGSITGAITAAPQVCETPYIAHGEGCCIDADENSICDNDDVDLVAYCLDENEDGVCDGHEHLVEVEQEPEETEPEPFAFNPHSVVASRQGFSISIDDFEYELYEDWGKVTRVDFSITNDAGYSIKPIVEVNVHDSTQNFAPRSPYIVLDTYLGIGEFIVVPGFTEASFTNLDKEKVLELTLKDENAWPHRPIVTVRKTFKLR